jgi:hypothetical protein
MTQYLSVSLHVLACVDIQGRFEQNQCTDGTKITSFLDQQILLLSEIGARGCHNLKSEQTLNFVCSTALYGVRF